MRKCAFSILLGATLLGCAGTVTVPRYEIRDIATGRVYTTEAANINKTAGGVTIRDEKSGSAVTLTTYEEHRIEDAEYSTTYNWWTGMYEKTRRIR